MATGLFVPMKHKYLADMISLKTPKEAAESCKKLLQEFRDAMTRPKRLRIARATQLAANRAKVMARRTTISPAERNEFRKIHILYKALATKLFTSYKGSG